MQFKNIFVLALPVAVLAAPIVAPAADNVAELVVRDVAAAEHQLGARQDIKQELIATVISAAKDIVRDVATAVAAEGVKKAGQAIKALKNWTPAREAFTKATSAEMWAKNPDPTKYAAAICYNMGYSITDPAGVEGLVKARLKSGLLKTDYDCFFMTAGNTMNLKGDGGFINLSFNADKRCTYDKNTKVIRC
ncbi:hypothetical protein RB597_002868 [Gaeumannomyces tritici]